MATWIYRKPEATDVRGLCVLCGKNLQKKTTKGTYYSLCSPCNKRLYAVESTKRYSKRVKENIKPKYGRYKKLSCEECDFVAKDRCQLDVHHIDGNHHNNDPNNLRTLCANCHRYEHCKIKNPQGELNLQGG